VRPARRDDRIVYSELHSSLDSVKNRKSNNAIVNIVEKELAEGVGFGRLLEVFSISITPRPPPHYRGEQPHN
jgi:hypothetical protein